MAISKTWIEVIVIALAALAAVGGYEWLQEHDARMKAEASAAAQQKSIDQAKAQADAAAKSLDDRLKALEAQRSQPVTAPQFVVDLSKVIPNLPQAAQVVQPPPTQQVVNGKTEQVPSAPVVQIPQADLQALQNYKITCDETAAKLDACTLTGAATATELKQTTAQRDEYQAALKGGTWWQRVTKSVKCLATSAAASGVGAWADKAQPERGAAIGALAGGVGCQFF